MLVIISISCLQWLFLVLDLLKLVNKNHFTESSDCFKHTDFYDLNLNLCFVGVESLGRPASYNSVCLP